LKTRLVEDEVELPKDQARFHEPHSWPALLPHDKMYTVRKNNLGPLVVAEIGRLHPLTKLIKIGIK
jgi:hypothetical protein